MMKYIALILALASPALAAELTVSPDGGWTAIEPLKPGVMD